MLRNQFLKRWLQAIVPLQFSLGARVDVLSAMAIARTVRI